MLFRSWQMAEALALEHYLARVEVVLPVVTLAPDAQRVRWLTLEAF